MNFRPEQKLSSEELKRRNGADLMMAMDTDRQVTLTEKNWMAVINILTRILEAQGKTDKHLDTLLTQADAEKHLDTLLTQADAEKHLNTLAQLTAQFNTQAGNVSERFSSDCEKLVSATQRNLDSITKSTERNLSNMTEHYRYELSDLVQSARRRLVTSSVLCWALTTLLAISYALAALLK